MAELMAEEGGAEALRELSLDFVAAGEAMLETLHDELDRSGSDHRRAQEILAEMAKVQSTQETDFKIAQAASCYLGG